VAYSINVEATKRYYISFIFSENYKMPIFIYVEKLTINEEFLVIQTITSNISTNSKNQSC